MATQKYQEGKDRGALELWFDSRTKQLVFARALGLGLLLSATRDTESCVEQCVHIKQDKRPSLSKQTDGDVFPAEAITCGIVCAEKHSALRIMTTKESRDPTVDNELDALLDGMPPPNYDFTDEGVLHEFNWPQMP